MKGFKKYGWRMWVPEEPEKEYALMQPEGFKSERFRRMAERLNTFLILHHYDPELPEFIRQLAAVVGDRAPDDPPSSGVLSRLPGDGSPSPGGRPLLVHLFFWRTRWP
jgi:hypothetical protein